MFRDEPYANVCVQNQSVSVYQILAIRIVCWLNAITRLWAAALIIIR